MKKWIVVAAAALLALVVGLWVKSAYIDPVQKPMKQIEKVVPKAAQKPLKKVVKKAVKKVAKAAPKEEEKLERRCILLYCTLWDKNGNMVYEPTPMFSPFSGG